MARCVDDIIRLTLQQAERDAVIFVAEFGEPIDSDTTDWDAEAWAHGADIGMRLTEEQDAECWPIYQAALELATERLCAAKIL